MTSQVMGATQAAGKLPAFMPEAFGALLKRWRTCRRLSQEQLAFDAQISTRHLSCLERSKANPSRHMVLTLSSVLELELRDCNVLLGSAGFSPSYTSSAMTSAAMAPISRAVDLILAQQEPYGAVVVDRLWNVLRLNDGAQRLLGAFWSAPPASHVASNVLRALLHPDGLRSSIVNWSEVAAFAMERLARECAMHPNDAERAELQRELREYPGVAALSWPTPVQAEPVATVHFRSGDVDVRLFTMLTTIGTPLDIAAQEFAIESYFPADEASERWVRRLSD